MSLDWIPREGGLKDHNLWGTEHFGTDAPCTIYEERPIIDPEGNPVEGLYSAWSLSKEIGRWFFCSAWLGWIRKDTVTPAAGCPWPRPSSSPVVARAVAAWSITWLARATPTLQAQSGRYG